MDASPHPLLCFLFIRVQTRFVFQEEEGGRERLYHKTKTRSVCCCLFPILSLKEKQKKIVYGLFCPKQCPIQIMKKEKKKVDTKVKRTLFGKKRGLCAPQKVSSIISLIGLSVFCHREYTMLIAFQFFLSLYPSSFIILFLNRTGTEEKRRKKDGHKDHLMMRRQKVLTRQYPTE